jgi:hypothetical protein
MSSPVKRERCEPGVVRCVVRPRAPSLSLRYTLFLSLSPFFFLGLDSRTFHRKSLNCLCFLFVLNLIDLNIVLLVLKFLIGCNLKTKTNE